MLQNSKNQVENCVCKIKLLLWNKWGGGTEEPSVLQGTCNKQWCPQRPPVLPNQPFAWVQHMQDHCRAGEITMFLGKTMSNKPLGNLAQVLPTSPDTVLLIIRIEETLTALRVIYWWGSGVAARAPGRAGKIYLGPRKRLVRPNVAIFELQRKFDFCDNIFEILESWTDPPCSKLLGSFQIRFAI